jgi:nucleotide-binding universal stress UspA family protein
MPAWGSILSRNPDQKVDAMVASIVVPLPAPGSDPGEISAVALPFAYGLAARTGASVALVTVVDEVPPFAARFSPRETAAPDKRTQWLTECQANLDRIATDLPMVCTERIVRSGNVVAQIVNVVRQLPDPILVVGSHGRGGISRLLRGSIAFRLVHEAPCPVLVVRGPALEGATEPTPVLSKVLVPLDRSAFAEHALNVALDTLSNAPLHVHVLHVVDESIYLGYPPGTARTHGERLGTRYLREVAERLIARGLFVTTEVRYGAPAGEIMRAAAEQKSDVIAMATHARDTAGWFFLGSVAESVLRESGLPVLLIRPDETAVEAVIEGAKEAAEQTGVEAPAPPPLWRQPISELMTPIPVVVREDTPLQELARRMLDHRSGAVPVVDDRGNLVGIITTSDLTGHDPWTPLCGRAEPDRLGYHEPARRRQGGRVRRGGCTADAQPRPQPRPGRPRWRSRGSGGAAGSAQAASRLMARC